MPERAGSAERINRPSSVRRSSVDPGPRGSAPRPAGPTHPGPPEQSAGITNLKAVPLLSDDLRKSYNYADIEGFMQRARLFPVPPTKEGQYATYDDFLEEYERLKRA